MFITVSAWIIIHLYILTVDGGVFCRYITAGDDLYTTHACTSTCQC